jgi:phage gp37-like protein
MNLRWEQRWPEIPGIWVLYLGTDEVGRVNRVSEGRWCGEVARHRRDDRRRHSRFFASREAAMERVDAWTRASLERIQSELPVRSDAGAGKCWVWPASNPPAPDGL